MNTPKTVKDFNDKQPLISVITVVYQGRDVLEDTIQSVINQSYKNLEYIIIDGGSTDGTVEIIELYQDKIDYWLSEPDKGISDAMNKGINLSSGTLISHLHAGDKFASIDTVAQIAESYAKDKWRWCFGNQSLIDVFGNTVGSFYPPRFSKTLLHIVNIIPHATVFSEKTLLQESGCFDNSYKCAMDYHLWLRFAKIAKPKQFNQTIAQFLLGGRSSNLKLALREEFRARKEVLNQSSLEQLFSLTIIYLRMLKRKLKITTFVRT